MLFVRIKMQFKGFKINKQLAKKLCITCISFIAVFAYYILMLKTQNIIGVGILYTLTGVTLIATVVFNGGFNKDIPTPEQLRDSWSAEKKERFIKMLVKGKAIAKNMMFVLFPLLVVVMIDLAYLYWFNGKL